MTWKSRGGGVLARGVPLGLLVVGGCAWFQNPPAPGFPEEASGPVVRSGPSPIAPFDSLAAPRSAGVPEAGVSGPWPEASSDTSVASTVSATPPDTLSVAAGASTPPDSLAVPPPAGGVVASAGPRAPGASDSTRSPSLEVADWHLDGKTLESRTGPEGQVIRMDEPVITHGTVIIQADSGRFEVDVDRAVLEGNVRFTDGALRGTAGHARYYREQALLLAERGVTVETDTLWVRGDEGTYDRGQEIVFLRGSVEGRRGSRRITSEEAEWFRLRDEVFFRGNAVVVDSVEHSTLSGERIRYDLIEDRAQVLESPTLLLSTGAESPIRISGEQLEVDPQGNALASGSVEIVRGGVIASADSAYFARPERVATLIGDPRLTERDGVMTGDTLLIHFDEEDELTHLEMHGNAGLRFQPVDSLRVGEVSTVNGDSLTMYFTDRGADRVVVFGNARSGYRPSPLDRSAGVGSNVVEGDTITIVLNEGRVERVRVTGGAKGTFLFGRSEEAPDTTGADTEAADTTAADTTGRGEAVALDTLAAGSTQGSGSPPPGPGPEKVVYSARTVEYSLDDRTVDLFEEAVLDYGQLNLTAGKVRFYADRKYLEAEDEPVLVDHSGGESRVIGKRMDYNLKSREGTIAGGRTRNEDGFIYSERLRQVGEETFLARDGNFTTCDLAEHAQAPHFHFTSKRMKIYLDDKVVAKPVVMYIRDIPVLAIPYYVFSIRKGRHSGFLAADLDLGIGSSTGRFFRNLGYYWAASEYWDGQLTFDYSDEPTRFVGRGLVKYAKRYLMSGSLSVAKTLSSSSDQYDITGAHQMTLGNWSLTARAEFRDQEFRRDDPLGPDFGSRLDRKLLSDASLSRSFAFGGSFYLTFRREEDLDAEFGTQNQTVILNETLPQYSFSINSRPLGRTADEHGEGARLPMLASLRFGFNSSGSSVHTVTRFQDFTQLDSVTVDTTVTEESERSSRALHTANLSDTRRLLGALNLTPSATVRENWVDREFSAQDTVKEFRRAATWGASIGANTALYGTFGGLGPVEGLRHTFRPSASLNYQPEFESLTYTELDTTGGDSVLVRRNRFPGVSAFESRSLSLNLEQSFQAKVRSGETTRRVELFRWNLGTSFDFLAKDRGQAGWRTINSTLDLSQIYGVGLNFNSSHDPYHQFRFETFQLTTGYGFSGRLPEGGDDEPAASSGEDLGQVQGDLDSRGADLAERDRPGAAAGAGDALNWNASFSFSYAGDRRDTGMTTSASINGHGSVRLTRNWSVEYGARWDITNGQILGNNLTLSRKLHCWEAQFIRSELGDDTTFYFRLAIAGMPDVRYEQGRRGGTGVGSLTQFLP